MGVRVKAGLGKGALRAYFSVCALCAGKHEPRVRQVITQVHVGSTAQNPASFLQGDIRFYGNGIGTNDWSAGTSLTLDFSTLGVSGKARTVGTGTPPPPQDPS